MKINNILDELINKHIISGYLLEQDKLVISFNNNQTICIEATITQPLGNNLLKIYSADEQ